MLTNLLTNAFTKLSSTTTSQADDNTDDLRQLANDLHKSTSRLDDVDVLKRIHAFRRQFCQLPDDNKSLSVDTYCNYLHFKYSVIIRQRRPFDDLYDGTRRQFTIDDDYTDDKSTSDEDNYNKCN